MGLCPNDVRKGYAFLSEFELGFALYQGVPLQSLPPGLGIDAVARIRAVRKAEAAIGIPRSAFHEVLRDLVPRLGASMSDAFIRLIRMMIAPII